MKLFRLLILVVIISFAKDSFGNKIYDLKSPNEKLSINFWITENGEPVYTISSLGITIIKQSRLGVIRSDGNFSSDLILDSVSNVKVVNDNYKLLHGKRLECNYSANKKIFYLKNSDSKKIEIIFQVSDDGVAFRYHFPEKSESKLKPDF